MSTMNDSVNMCKVTHLIFSSIMCAMNYVYNTTDRKYHWILLHYLWILSWNLTCIHVFHCTCRYNFFLTNLKWSCGLMRQMACHAACKRQCQPFDARSMHVKQMVCSICAAENISTPVTAHTFGVCMFVHVELIQVAGQFGCIVNHIIEIHAHDKPMLSSSVPLGFEHIVTKQYPIR